MTAPSGNWQFQDGFQSASAGPVTQSQLLLEPFTVGPRAKTFTDMGVQCTTAAVGGTGVGYRMGIYYDDGSGGLPGALLVDLGQVALSATGIRSITLGSLVLEPGRYWLAGCYQYTTAPSTAAQVGNNGNVGASLWGAAFLTNYRAVQATGITGALPNPPTGMSSFNGAPQLGLKAA